MIAQCTNLTSQAVLRKFGIDGKKLGAAVEAKGGAGAPDASAQTQPAAAPSAAPAQPPMGA
jgi:hypothetical protein